MSQPNTEFDLRCAACGHTQFFDLPRMIQSLQAAGQLKRAKDPPPQMVSELFQSRVEEMPCRQCGQTALVATEPEQWDDDPIAARGCERCNAPIDPDRLEIFPDTVLCTACQRASEANPGGGEEADYCPRCGAVMKLRASSRGVARYVQACPDCGYR